MKTILIVDDHAGFLQTISWLLESHGFVCLSAQTPTEAQRTFAESTVDLVITDYLLPQKTGVELAAHLRLRSLVPIIMLTGDPTVLHKPEPIDVLLHKPVDATDLLRSIALLLPESHRGAAS